jgi:hypothetical protein
MAIVFALNSLFLAIVGAVMLAAPRKLFPTADALGLAVTQATGIGDLAMATVTGVLLASRGASAPPVAGLAVFHLGLTLVLALNRNTAFFRLPALLSHAALGTAFVWVLTATVGVAA